MFLLLLSQSVSLFFVVSLFLILFILGLGRVGVVVLVHGRVLTPVVGIALVLVVVLVGWSCSCPCPRHCSRYWS